MKEFVIGVVGALVLIVVLLWLVAFTDRMGISGDSVIDRIFDHAERTAEKILERRKKC